MLAEMTITNIDTDLATLTTDQMIFMLLNHNRIHTAMLEGDYQTLSAISHTARYRTLFDTMSVSEAFARYETACMDELVGLCC